MLGTKGWRIESAVAICIWSIAAVAAGTNQSKQASISRNAKEEASATELRSPLQLVDLLSMIQPQEVAISPDGARIAYTYPSRTANKNEARGTAKGSGEEQKVTQLYVQPFDGGTPILLGSESADNSSPVWSQDASKLAFYAAYPQQRCLAVWNSLTNAIHNMSLSPSGPVQWTPN